MAVLSDVVKDARIVGLLASAFFTQTSQLSAGENDFPHNSNNTISKKIENQLPDVLQNLKDQGRIAGSNINLAHYTYQSLSEASQKLFCIVANRSTKSASESILSQKDFTGTTLAQTLAQLTSTKFHPLLEPQRNEIIENFLIELGNPGELNQASWGVCGTGLVYQLFQDFPAEAARLTGALLMPEVNCKFKDGSPLERALFTLEPDRSPGRSTTERLLMSALMERANGSLKYCTVCDSHFNPSNGAISHIGLTNLEISTLYGAVFAQPQAWRERPNTASGLMEFLKEQSTSLSFVPVSLHWSKNEAVPKTYKHALLVPEPSINQHRTLVSEGSSAQKIDENHFVLVVKVEADKVFFRNLHGPSSLPKGTILTNPPRILEDPKLGIESMAYNEIANRLLAVFRPQE